mmetsp:Transcript_45703/g.136588  ORF Transcript_45703/g.136588 Transcript_45703/m.136588 type:complete len:368 (-) Transcript_45703:181-1284(-)
MQGAVCHPRCNSRASQVLPAADEVDLCNIELTARSDVLDSKGSVTNDSHILAFDFLVVDLIEHGIPNVPVEDILAFVSLLPGQGQVSREHADAADVHRLLLPSGLRGGRQHLAVLQPALLHALGGELVPLDAQGLGARELPPTAHDLHGLHVGVQADVGHDPDLVRDALKVIEERVAGRPGGREVRGDGELLPVGEVVGPVLRLQLRGAVRLVHPRGTADPEHAVEDDEVEVLPLVQKHRHPQADVPRADDGLGVAVLVRQPLERLDPLDRHVPGHLLVRVHDPVDRALLLHEADLLGRHGELPGEALSHLLHRGPGLRRKRLSLARRQDLQRDRDPALAGLHCALWAPGDVVAHGVRRPVQEALKA